MQRDAFVEILKAEFDRKRARNEAYSLRAFSKYLGVDVSNLSKILNYQKAAGKRLKSKLAQKIGLSEADLAQQTELSSNTRDTSYSEHTLDVFKIISRVHHYAILETFKLKDFSPTPKNIAAHLGLSLAETKSSMARLKSTGLLVEKNGAMRPADESSSAVLSVATSKSHRDQQREILEGAIVALENVAIEHRSQSSMTMAIDTNKIDAAKVLIKKFRRDMGRLLSDSENLDAVYQLSVSLYPSNFKKESL